MAQEHHNKTMNAIRQFFDERAAGWDQMISAEHPYRLATIIERLDIASDARVLDVGCGTGVLLPPLAEKLVVGDIVAMDLSFAMMRETRNRIASLNCRAHGARISVLQGDISMPPFAPGVFDWVFCNSCFPHFHDQQAALSVMAGLLREGGRLVICHTESRDAINTMHRHVGDIVGGHLLPDEHTFRLLLERARLELIALEDASEAYVLIAG